MDTARELHPDERMYTYWVNDKAFREGRGFRMDFVLLNAALRRG
jgi:exonuclease III